MAIPQDLVSIKAPGVYRLEYDLSNMQPSYESTYSRGRLVPGFSYKGPFNKPFKITTTTEFTNIFGDIDPKLEANGCYFHRTALELLKEGPIIALNLHSYKDNDKVIEGAAIGTKKAIPFKTAIHGAFDTSMWYEPWPDRLKATYENGTSSVIAKENPYILCDFGDTDFLTWDPLENEDSYANYDYFNVAILSDDVSTNCDDLWYIEGQKPIGRIHLCRYNRNPDAYDNTHFIDTSVEPVDILLYNPDVYKQGVNYTTDSLSTSERLVAPQISEDGSKVVIVYEPAPGESEAEIITLKVAKAVSGGAVGNRITVMPNQGIELNPESDETYSGSAFIILANASGDDIRAHVYKTPSDTSDMLAYDIPISDYYEGNIPFALQEYLDENGFDAADYNLSDFIFTLVIFNDVTTLSNDMLSLKESWGLGYHSGSLQFIRYDDSLYDCNGMSGVITYTGASIPGLTNASGVDISIDTFLRKLAKTTNIVGYTIPYCEKGVPADNRIMETVRLGKIEVGVEPCIDNENNYRAIINTLRDNSTTQFAYAVTERNPTTSKFYDEPSGVALWGKTNMWKAVTDRVILSFRYLVDCWAYGLETSSKELFAQICMKQHATGILNAPSAITIAKNPNLVDEYGGINYKTLATTSDVFSVPNIKSGSTFIGYFYPWLRLGETKLIPPSAKVANLFYLKPNPWSAVAGPVTGVLSNVTPEVSLSREDREWLSTIGFNPIIDVGDDQHTICVYGNKTAKQRPVSALSALNFRDFVVYIMDEIENILIPYVFMENTESVRTEIVSKVETFLKSVTATANRPGGLIAYEVTMDGTNNTAELIDNFYGIIDIKIEGARAMEKIAQRLYILPTGALTTQS